MLKFESLAKIGDIIKAFDFKPMGGRDDYFLTGIVTAKGKMYKELENGNNHYIGDGYTVKVIGGDEDSKERIGLTMFVPYEVDFMEYDERVSLVATAEELELVMEAV